MMSMIGNSSKPTDRMENNNTINGHANGGFHSKQSGLDINSSSSNSSNNSDRGISSSASLNPKRLCFLLSNSCTGKPQGSQSSSMNCYCLVFAAAVVAMIMFIMPYYFHGLTTNTFSSFYFDSLFSNDQLQNVNDLDDQSSEVNHRVYDTEYNEKDFQGDNALEKITIQSKSSQNPTTDAEYATDKLIFIIGTTRDAVIQTSIHIQDATKISFPRVSSIENTISKETTIKLLELTASILNATRGDLHYKHSALPTKIRMKLQALAQSIASIGFSSTPSTNHPYLVIGLPPPALLILPSLFSLFHSSTFILSTLHGVDVAFDTSMISIAQHIGPYMVDESKIDKVCSDRRDNKATQLDSDGKTQKVPSCNILEIPILRSAILWSQILDLALLYVDSLQLIENEKVFLLGLDQAQSTGKIISDLTKAFPDIVSESSVEGQKQDSGKDKIDLTIITKNSWYRSKRLHKFLVNDVVQLLSETALKRFGYKELPPLVSSPDIPFAPISPPIDAGTCKVIEKFRDDKDDDHPYAYCLPSLIIAGAQKAGTDELAVWLNFSPFFRRLDGGPETHFFDCVGRGEGKERSSCYRARNPSMVYKQTALSTEKAGDKKHFFRWSVVREKSFYVSDIWARYATLGHLDYSGYNRIKRLVIFEKSPSYMDLADPHDIIHLLPSVKLVFLIRNPVDRVYSGYWQSCLSDTYDMNDSMLKNLKGNKRKCSVERFTQLTNNWIARNINGDKFVDDEDLEQIEIEDFDRAVRYGEYSRHLKKWLDVFPNEQILLFFSDHFKFFPQAIVHAIEEYVGNTGVRHHYYEPTFKDGFYVLGDFSKATHPSHHGSMDPKAKELLENYYAKWNKELHEMIKASDPETGLMRGINMMLESPKEYLHGKTIRLPKWISDEDEA